MAFAFTDEQRALAEAVGALLADHATGEYARAVIDEPARWRELWERVAELGLPGMTAPEAAGGLALGPVEVTAVAEAAGRFLAPVPLVATCGAFVPAVAAAGPQALELLREVSETGASGTLAVPDPTPEGIRAAARVEGARLTASIELVPEAGRADWVALFATDERGGAALVACRADDLPLVPRASADPTRPVAGLDVDALELGDAIVVAADPAGPLTLALVAAAAELVGLADELVRRSIGHAQERQQFGSPIGAFQAVKHRLVDAHLGVERARSLTYRAAVAASAIAPGDGGPPQREAAGEALVAAQFAKAAAGEAAIGAARAAVQVHGGIGITREHDVSLMYLRARQASALMGDPDRLYLTAVAGELAAGSAPGAR